MLKKLILSSVIVAGLALPSCNSSDNSEYQVELASTVIVNGFSLTEDKNVLDSLQNVFFTIDLVSAQIFNADSLPYGTKISRLLPVINTPSSVSAVTVEFPRIGMSDSIVNYLTNSTDSIDFSNGPVKLRVKSQSGLVERVYSVKVNVHQTKPDTLAWKAMESAPMPSSLNNPVAQGLAKYNGTYYCLTTNNQSYSLAKTLDPADPEWEMSQVDFSFTPNIESLRATVQALYMLDQNGALYSSTDGENWQNTGEQMHYLYGQYADLLLGCKQVGNDWKIASYPDGKTWDMPEGFPVSGTSLPSTYESPLALSAQWTIFGGRDAQGNLIDSSWSFDGSEWAKVSLWPLPKALEDVLMVPYYVVEVPKSTWSPVSYPALLVMGGRDREGKINESVYMSLDWGMTWKLAPDLMQLPSSVAKVYGAKGFVHSSTLNASRSAKLWTSISLKNIPPQCDWISKELAMSRVEKPITEWECPYIYMYGGKDSSGQFQSAVWRGVILRYTFKPVY